MRKLAVLAVWLVPMFAWAQQEVRSLQPAHRAALGHYLNSHKECDFLPESVFGEKQLAYMREELGNHFQHPYYIVGDFNHDGQMDFAMVLAVEYDNQEDTERIVNERIVIWNGTKDGYCVAWEDDQPGTDPALDWANGFLSWSWEKKSEQRLTFGYPETDVGFLITPAGDTYIAEGSGD